MSHPVKHLATLSAALALLGAGAAWAEDKPATTPPARTEAVPPVPAPATARDAPTPGPTTETRLHVRSSHTVDVIAPGEKVDTILGRMRVERSAPPPRGETVPPPPGPDSGGKTPHGPGRSGPGRPGEGGRAPPPPGGDDFSPSHTSQPPQRPPR